MWIHLCVACAIPSSPAISWSRKFHLNLDLIYFYDVLEVSYIFPIPSLPPSTAFFWISLNFWYFLLFCERKTTESQQCARLWSQENITSQFLLIMCGGQTYMQQFQNVPKGRHSTCEPVGIYSWHAVRRRSCYPSMTTLHTCHRIAIKYHYHSVQHSNPPINMR